MNETLRPPEPQPCREGPWPSVSTRGELDAALPEWVHTNGAGAYAMSTLALMHTRRHHGMLVAALDPPLDRHVILSHAETRVETASGKSFAIAAHQFPGMAPTPGYRLLHSFHQDPIPRWIYRLGKAALERRLCLARGRNCVVLSYTWYGGRPARLTLKPLMPLRPARALTREHGAMVQRVSLRRGAVEMRPLAQLPPVTFGHDGVFVGSPAWWRRFEYTEDPRSNEPSLEDLWTPGHFELVLQPGEPVHLVIALGPQPAATATELVEETESHLLAQDLGPERPRAVRVLGVAADQFVVAACEHPAIIAGYPFYDVRTRDVLIGATGLLLARWRIDDAKRVLRETIADLRSGLLPERRAESKADPVARSADATLWLFEVARELVVRTGPDDAFVRGELYPALRRAFVRLRSGRTPGMWLSPEGLVANGLPDVALTWMAARAGDRLVTPRRGLAVELQALWTRGSDTLASLAREYEEPGLAELCELARDAARDSFRRRFWCEATGYPYDCISEPAAGDAAWTDPSVRPNALIALAVDPDLFERWQAAAIVARVRQELLTPLGVRSLAPGDPAYFGVHVGPPEERESSYHQGTAWTWLLGCYARAALRLDPDDFERREELRVLIEQLALSGPVLGQVAQLADGDEPHRPRGCPAQAWSVGELLRTLVCDLSL